VFLLILFYTFATQFTEHSQKKTSMGFFGKIKQMLGIGTVSAKIDMVDTFSTDDADVKGKIVVTGKSDQEIVSVEIKLEEQYSTGSGDNKSTSEIKLGEIKLPGFSIKSGEVKNVEFTLPFSYGKSQNESMAAKGGLVGGLGKVGSFMNNEKSTFRVVATVDVKGATFDPNDVKTLKRAK
jgi:SpoOM protein